MGRRKSDVLGANFPKPSADVTNMYRLRIFAKPGTSRELKYEVLNILTRDVATGTITTNLPPTTTFLNPKLYTSVGGVSAVTGVTVGPMQFQTEPY